MHSDKEKHSQLGKWVFLISVLLVTCALLISSFYMASISKPFAITDLLPKEHQTRIDYERFQAETNEENTAQLLIKNTAGAFTGPEIYYLSELLKKNLRRTPYIIRVTTPIEAEYLAEDKTGYHLVPFIYRDKPITEKAKGKLKLNFFKNKFLNEDFTSFLVGIEFRSDLKGKEEKESIKDLFELVAAIKEFTQDKYQLDFHLIGPKVIKKYFLDEMLTNQNIISPLIMVMISIAFLFFFRSFKILFLGLFTILLAYQSVILLIMLVDGGFTPYNGLALIFTLIVGTSDLVHFFSHYQTDREGPNADRIKRVKNKILIPCFLTSLTTVIGFSSLYFSEMVPIAYFGLYCSFGSVMAFVLTFYFLPKLISHSGEIKIFSKTPELKINFLTQIILKFSKTIIFSFILMVLSFSYFLAKLELKDDFYKKFVAAHPLSKTIKVFENDFKNVGTIDVELRLKDETFNWQTANSIFDNMEQELKAAGVFKIDSIREVSRYVYANTGTFHHRAHRFIEFLAQRKVLGKYMDDKQQVYRGKLFLKNLESKDIIHLGSKIKKFEFDGHKLNIQGFAAIRSFLVNSVVENFVYSFGFSFFLIFLVFLFYFKSPIIGIIAMIPNIIPLIIMGGLFQLFGGGLESNLVILLCISIGVAVDDTIHFLFSLKNHQKINANFSDYLSASYNDTSKALIGTTLIFFLCIPCLFIADLKLMVQMGFFILGVLSLALVTDFVLLPALLKNLPAKSQ